MPQTDQCEKWLKVAANLRVDRKNNIAPHKPLLLLVVAELAEQGKLEPILPLTGELVFRFLAFWTVVANRRSQKPNIRLPFYHMRSDGCWTPLNEKGAPTLERMRAAAAQFDESFFSCLQREDFRQQLRRVLIARYFVDAVERTALYALVGLPMPPDDVIKADARLYEQARERGREARFRLTVVPAYNYTCALTAYRLVTVDSDSIVDAAHIHQFSDSRNNHPRNGIALCKNAHWMFDQGLWSLTDDYKVIVASERFHESGPDVLLLRSMRGNAFTCRWIRIFGQGMSICSGIGRSGSLQLCRWGNRRFGFPGQFFLEEAVCGVNVYVFDTLLFTQKCALRFFRFER